MLEFKAKVQFIHIKRLTCEARLLCRFIEKTKTFFQMWCRPSNRNCKTPGKKNRSNQEEEERSAGKQRLLLKRLAGILPSWQFSGMRFSCLKKMKKQHSSLKAWWGGRGGLYSDGSQQTMQHLIRLLLSTGGFKPAGTAFNGSLERNKL